MQKPCNKCELAHSYTFPSGRVVYYCSKWGRYVKCDKCEKFAKYEKYLESRRQYRMGDTVKDVNEFLSLVKNGETLFYWRGVIRHYKVLESQQFRILVDLIDGGHICRAIKK